MAVTIAQAPEKVVYCRGNDVVFKITTDQASGTANLRIGLQLVISKLDDTGAKTYLFSVDPIFNGGAGYALFELSGFLHDYFQEFDLPQLNTHSIINAAKATCKYTVEAWDIYETTTTDPVAWSETGKAVWGGIAWEWDNGNKFLTERMDGVLPEIPFLTWHPKAMIITPTQNEFLAYFVSRDSISGIRIKVKCYFTDGTSPAEYVPFDDFTSVTTHLVYYVPVGWLTNLQMDEVLTDDGKDEKNVSKYDVWLTDQDDVRCSEIRTFILDRKYYKNRRFFLFQTSLYGPDTIHCTGEAEHSIETTSRQVSLNVNPYPYSLALGQNKDVDTTIQKTVKVTTGELTQADVNWLDDFFVSPNKFELVQGRFVPIRILSKKVNKGRDNDQRRTISFEYEYRWINVVVTPAAINGYEETEGGGGGEG